MPDEFLLREGAREVIRRGKFPSRRPDRTATGPGVGPVCTVSGRRVTSDEVGYVMEFAYGADGFERYDVHLDCFAAWDLERTNIEGQCRRTLEPETKRI